MKRRIIPAALFLVLSLVTAPVLFSQDAEVVYAEGEVDLKDKNGELYWVEIGDYVETGETIITGYDGQAEIEKGDVSVLKIAPNTVFTYMEAEVEGEKRDVFSCALGSVAFKFSKVIGKEPLITTGSVVAGVRGTEFTVFAGVDGSSLLVVDSGEVAVTSEGETVTLVREEGVEVQPGEPPGEKFKVLRGQVDYSTWNSGRSEELIADPVQAVERVGKRLSFFEEEIASLLPVFEEHRTRLEQERKNLETLEEEQGKDARVARYKDVVFPLEVKTSYLAMNIRYYALSALSFRRFVLGRMYLLLKGEYLMNPGAPEYRGFLEIYEELLNRFERSVTPHLVKADF